ncbi:MAG: right-handed parallel beta-helix repeat-containing protein, partial [Candidatus Cloacimonetes bacterium]|nr:right-handed parallel beta-helix repeat-containing protein [Candidatus Cloacimonadota bacterium]
MKTLILIFVLLLTTYLYSTIINVPEDQPTIQAGIDAAVDADTVLVQPGSYVENINYNGKLITVASLFLTTQDTTYISQTIIDGNNNNGRLVTFENEETDEAKLIGFTIKNGYGEYFYREDAVGVGIYIINSSPCIENNIIEDNNCGMYQNGGGIGIQNSSAKIKNNIIRNNDGAYYGGGIYVYQSEGVLIENNMIYNHITQSGFGVAYGAGICINQSNNIIVINNMIYNNTVDFGGGGGVAFLESSSDLINVTIRGNSATHYGGIYCYSSNLSLTNVTITGNDGIYGGGIYCSHSSPSLQNVTISGNLSSSGGGIYCNWDSNPTLMNCILWNNSPEEIYFSSYDAPNSITMSYSDIQGGEDEIVTNNNGTVNWLEGNIDEDPLFVGTGEHPYSLLE